jgi:hypothetical protein
MGAWELPAAVLFYGVGLLFWPVFQLFHRRRSPCSKRLLIVFFITFGVEIGYGVLLLSICRGHQWFPLLLLYPILNLISLVISTVVFLVSPKKHDTGAS